MSDLEQTDIASAQEDNLVLFPSSRSFPEDRRDPVQGLLEDFESLEVEMDVDEETIVPLDELSQAGAEVQDQDVDSLNLSEIMQLTMSQLGILKETGQRIDYLLREIESVLPRRK